MKNLLLLAFTVFASAAFAQATFDMTPDTVSVLVDLDQTDVEVHNDMVNLTSTDRTITWERTIIIMTPDTLLTEICDPIACFAPWISTHTFNLKADTTVPIIAHLLKEQGQDGCGIIQLKFTDAEFPNNPQYSYYVFECAASSTHEQLPAANVKLYPNPVVESFSLGNADDVSRIRVFSTDGRQAAVFDAEAGQKYSIVNLPSGSYVVALETKSGRVFQAIGINKN